MTSELCLAARRRALGIPDSDRLVVGTRRNQAARRVPGDGTVAVGRKDGMNQPMCDNGALASRQQREGSECLCM